MLLLAAILGAIGFGVFRYLSKKNKKSVKILNPKEKALQSLEQLQKFAKSGSGLKLEDWKIFSYQLVGCIRNYTDENFNLDSKEKTDTEFLQTIRYIHGAKNYENDLSTILKTLDEVRYGKKTLESGLVPDLLSQAKNYVQSSFTEKAPESEGKK